LKQKEIIENAFDVLGFKIIYWNDKPNANGVDCVVQKGSNKPLSVEVKKLKINNKTNALSVEAIHGERRNDDLIAIIINKNYVLIEPMSQHLKSCSIKGFRPMTAYK